MWKLARDSGRKYEVLFGQVPAVKGLLETCRHDKLDLRGQLDRAREQNWVLEQRREVERGGEIDLPADVQDALQIRAKLSRDDIEVWRLRDSRPLPHLRDRLLASGLIILTIGNLKGGVGKTTITANLAAYLARKLGKRVLIIDLDYQGSLSATMLQLAGKTIQTSIADYLIGGQATGRTLVESAIQISKVHQNVHIIPSGYTLAAVEEQLMMRWLFHTTDKDVRFNLAEVLLSEEVRAAFDVVLLDVGPRLTTASISALCASTHFLVPTNLDKLSAETIGSFLNRVRALKEGLGLPIELAGVVGTMSYYDALNDDEKEALATIREGLRQWGPDAHVFERTIPRKKVLADVAGSDVGYLKNREVRTIFDTLGQQVATRIGL